MVLFGLSRGSRESVSQSGDKLRSVTACTGVRDCMHLVRLKSLTIGCARTSDWGDFGSLEPDRIVSWESPVMLTDAKCMRS